MATSNLEPKPNHFPKPELHPPADGLRAPEQTPVARPGETLGREKLGPSEPAPANESFNPFKRKRPTKVVIPQVRDEVTLKIEKIMEDGIGESYSRLSPVAQQEFKLKGEETAYKVRELLKATHVKVKKIFWLILEWLRMLPGVNRFFLEQEAKIKTDKIVHLNKK